MFFSEPTMGSQRTTFAIISEIVDLEEAVAHGYLKLTVGHCYPEYHAQSEAVDTVKQSVIRYAVQCHRQIIIIITLPPSPPLKTL